MRSASSQMSRVSSRSSSLGRLLEELRGAADARERVLDLVRQHGAERRDRARRAAMGELAVHLVGDGALLEHQHHLPRRRRRAASRTRRRCAPRRCRGVPMSTRYSLTLAPRSPHLLDQVDDGRAERARVGQRLALHDPQRRRRRRLRRPRWRGGCRRPAPTVSTGSGSAFMISSPAAPSCRLPARGRAKRRPRSVDATCAGSSRRHEGLPARRGSTAKPAAARRVGIGGEVLAGVAQPGRRPVEGEQALVVLDRQRPPWRRAPDPDAAARRGRPRSARRARAARRRRGRPSRRRRPRRARQRRASSTEPDVAVGDHRDRDRRDDRGDARPSRRRPCRIAGACGRGP